MKVVILGAGEMASGTACRLFRCGISVAMTEVAQPMAVRRAVSFCEAVWDREAVVEGVIGRLWSDNLVVPDKLDHVAVFIDPKAALVGSWLPDVVVDARLLKTEGVTSVDMAPLVVSLGPGAVAGRDAHVVVETNRGHDLGRLIYVGSAAADTGVPGEIGGFTAQRVLRSPASGPVRCLRRIGDCLAANEPVASVAGVEVTTAIAGVLRGILHDGVMASKGMKLGDVDPRGIPDACFTVSDKSRNIAGSVLEAILRRYPVVRI